jgi:hypothetical protein
MSVVYPFTVLNISDPETKMLLLDSKLSIDLDIGSYYLNSDYDDVNNLINVNFNTDLDFNQKIVLNNVFNIIVYGAVPLVDVYIFNPNTFSRRSPKVNDPPTAETDYNLGYTVGSIVLTLADEIYICTDNTIGAAVWRQLTWV